MIKKGIKILIILFAICAFSLSAFYFYIQRTMASSANLNCDKIFVINQGESLDEILNNLESKCGLTKKLEYKINLILTKKNAKIKAGQYELRKEYTYLEITEILVGGEIKTNTITIPEGYTLEQIAKTFDEKNLVSKNEFLANARVSSFNYDFLAGVSKSESLEGYLFPDTYKFDNEVTTDEAINKMLGNFDKKLSSELRDEIKKQGKSIREIVIVASLLEKEVKTKNDRQIVAGLIYERIKTGQPLQLDSTVNYVTGKNSAQPTILDTKVSSPYNTYQNKGLPPGPISNPGVDALYAAIYPIQTEYLYYLNRQDTGETIFSKTYEEHLANKNKYLK